MHVPEEKMWRLHTGIHYHSRERKLRNSRYTCGLSQRITRDDRLDLENVSVVECRNPARRTKILMYREFCAEFVSLL
ncbi:hypothetical protein X777_16399 [Ooceraea biroi]|uniref:Uncharacterized protein n=1 Tax=Ooceraea biroi TaxID=2015173 RepID=A0A026WUH7_OOCBI|nr:hypothetical protein X777_16399 [Ooceraea biroi]